MLDNKQLWSSVLLDIETTVSKANFSTWFKNTCIVKQDDGVVYVGVPNAFVKDWLFNKYHKNILRSLRTLSEGVRALEYVVLKDGVKPKEDAPQKTFLANELPLADLYIDKRDNLNPRYTFDSFIIGPFNELAHAASQAVIRNPGSVYNPLFIYGSTGLGKTHLIQSVGNHLKKELGRRVHYITSERFSIDYISSVQNNTTHDFKEKYRKYDVLIMDDIQFLSRKEKTQEELFHLFNTLYDSGRQIIFSSDQHPTFIPDLEERLKSRFGAGMIVDVSQPDYESRVAILKSKAEQRQFFIPEDVLGYLASSLEVNIRELEGILNSVIMQTQIKNRDLGLDEVKGLIKNNTKPKKSVSVKDVVKIVASFYDIHETVIYEKTRKKEVVKPRQVVMYLLREYFNISYPSIGQKLGGRDHTTVMHSCEKIKTDMKNDNILSQEIEQLRALI